MGVPHETGGDEVALARHFALISDELLTSPQREVTLQEVVHWAVETVPGAHDCGVTLLDRRDRTLHTAACTTARVKALDSLQYQLREGPCWDAVWVLDTIVVTDMIAETRWPQWAPAAVQTGVGSVLSVRVATHDRLIGGLNLYARTPEAFDNDDAALAAVFARHAARALAVADRAEGLQTAVLSRQTIGAAQGMLMQRYGLTLDQSFEVLRRTSQDRNIKVRDLAAHLVRTGRVTGISDHLDD